jgi:Ca2+-binding RTX toxin-like protein
MARIVGTSSFDFLQGTTGNDEIFGLGGPDTITATTGNDSIEGGEGFDAIVYSNLNSPITLTPMGMIIKGNNGGIDRISGIERIVGQAGLANAVDASSITSGNVGIEVNLGGNFINVYNIPGTTGLRGFTIENFVNATGTVNNDTFTGSSRNNVLRGLGGSDFFVASAGNDTLDGGVGFDVADYSNLNTAITLGAVGTVSKGQFGQDSLIQIESIIGRSGLANAVDASAVTSGTTFVNINLSINRVDVNNIPGLGNRIFFVTNFVNTTGTSNADTITGSALNNVLIGGGGNDVIDGGDGNDFINGTNFVTRGFSEFDTLRGGSGNDTFVLGDRTGSYYVGNGNNDNARIQDLSVGDSIQLGLGRTYRAVGRTGGFDLFTVGASGFDRIALVNTTTSIGGLPTSNFTLASGQRSSIFIGA